MAGIRVNSFISNFKPTFVLLAGFFVALGVTHSILISYFSRVPVTPQNQNQENFIKIETFVHDLKNCQIVLLGSSLMALLEETYFDDHVCNLAFGGLSSESGAAVVEKSQRDKKINKLVVELNVQKPVDTNMIEASYHSLSYFLGGVFPQLLTRNQPITMLLSLVRYLNPPAPKTVTQEQFDTMFKIHQLAASSLDSTSELEYRNHLLSLRHRLSKLKDTQVQVIWLPADPRLANANGNIRRLQIAKEIFDPSSWTWIDVHLESLETTDGIHMTQKSAEAFSTKLKSFL